MNTQILADSYNHIMINLTWSYLNEYVKAVLENWTSLSPLYNADKKLANWD